MRWGRKPMTEAECYARLYGGPREIRVIRTDAAAVTMLPGARLRRLLGLRERKAA